MLTPKEFAYTFKLSSYTVRAWLRQGKIKGVKFGGLWMITNEEVERLKKEGTLHEQKKAEKN